MRRPQVVRPSRSTAQRRRRKTVPIGDVLGGGPSLTRRCPELAGAEQRSDSDPNDKTSPSDQDWPSLDDYVPIFDLKTTGLPTHHKPTGAYIMWAGTPYAHVHVMGRPLSCPHAV